MSNSKTDNNVEHFVGEEFHNLRLDKFLFGVCSSFVNKSRDYSRSKIQKFIKEGRVFVNKNIVKDPALLVQKTDYIRLVIDDLCNEILAEEMELDILYEDRDLIVLNKSIGVAVHPGLGIYQSTLVNGLLYYSKDLSNIDSARPGIVHRLDKNTSGIMVVAKNNEAHFSLAEQIRAKTLVRKYKALVWGNASLRKSNFIDAPIARSAFNRLRMCVDHSYNSKSALTFYKTLETFLNGTFSFVECSLSTGRTHQIRVHMEYIRHPIVGDPIYSKFVTIGSLPKVIKQKILSIKTQILHSYYIKFTHPSQSKVVEITQNLPQEHLMILDWLRSM